MQLPRSVQELVDVLGEERALFLIGQLPRCYNSKQFHVILYVPTVQRLTLDHDLVRILGWNDALRLSRAFGGEILHPAPCASIYKPFRDAHIVRFVRDGVPTAMVAEWFGMSERQVRNLAKEIPQEEQTVTAAHNSSSLTISRKGRKSYEQELEQATA